MNKQSEKTLGVLGGLGPMATAYFLELMVTMTDAATDQDHPKMIIMNVPTVPDRTAYILGRSTESPLEPMAALGQQLKALGADIIATPCITAHYFHSDLSVNDIARFAGVSPQYLNTVLRRKTTCGIRQNLIRIRLEHAAELLENPDYTVKDAAALTGWKSPFYFGNSFRRRYGISPGEYRKRQLSRKNG